MRSSSRKRKRGNGEIEEKDVGIGGIGRGGIVGGEEG